MPTETIILLLPVGDLAAYGNCFLCTVIAIARLDSA